MNENDEKNSLLSLNKQQTQQRMYRQDFHHHHSYQQEQKQQYLQQQQIQIIPLEGRAYRNFINAIKTSATQKSYSFFLQKYMQFYNITNVDDLLIDKHNPVSIEENIINWIVAMRRDPNFTVTYSTRRTYLAAILFFYDINDVILRKKKLSRFLGEEATRKRKDRAYTREEIKKMLDYAGDIRSKVTILLLTSTGMRIGALSELKIRHLKKMSEPYSNIYRITIYENTNEEYYTFCTPECTKTIDEYFAYRKKSGEKTIVPDAPLIRERFDRIDLENSRKPKVMSTRAISGIIYNLSTKSGLNDVAQSTETKPIRKGSERKDVKRTHGFRKFCNTNMVNANVKPVVKEMLLGHKTGLDTVYYKPEEGELLQEYVKAIDYLTINDEHRLQKQVTELTQKQEDIELMKVEQRRKDLELREQMQHQQQQYQRMIEEFQDRDRKEKEELRREIAGTMKALRQSVIVDNDDSRAKNKAYHLQPEDLETKETLKKAETRAYKQLKKDTLERSLEVSRRINNRIQQQQA